MQRQLRLLLRVGEAQQAHHAGDDAGEPVIIAAARNAVDMRADQNVARRVAIARKAEMRVEAVVEPDVEATAARELRKIVQHLSLDV